MLPVRVILDSPESAAVNMARDEALLDHAVGTTLRRTAWSAPAATLGRFQPYAVFELDGAPRESVRRITGGGTIFHGRDLTVALVTSVPSEYFQQVNPEYLAQRASGTLLAALRQFEPTLRARGGNDREREQVAIVDCFERQSPYDVITVEGRKVAGFALHRRKDRVLVQGSIDRQLGAVPVTDDEDLKLLTAWARALGADDVQVGALTEVEREATDVKIAERYGSEAWNQR